jgi:hypothetical protein
MGSARDFKVLLLSSKSRGCASDCIVNFLKKSLTMSDKVWISNVECERFLTD